MLRPLLLTAALVQSVVCHVSPSALVGFEWRLLLGLRLCAPPSLAHPLLHGLLRQLRDLLPDAILVHLEDQDLAVYFVDLAAAGAPGVSLL